MDDGGLLVCVYYRVAGADAAHAIQAVREFQRTLPARFGETQARVLLRWAIPAAAVPPDAPPASPIAASVPDADATLMETYRVALPAADGPVAEAHARAFLEALAAAAGPLGRLLRGERHVELFAPCAW